MSTTDGQQQVSKPLQIILGVVVGLAALYALWTFVLAPLLGGEDEVGSVDPADPPVVVPEDGTPVPGTENPDDPTLSDDEIETLFGEPVPETFGIFTARDPFQQLVVEVESGQATVQEADDPDVIVDVDVDAGDDTEVTVGTTGSTTSGTTSGSSSSDDSSDAPTTPPVDNDEAPADGTAPQGDVGEEIYEPVGPAAGSTEITLDAVSLTGDSLDVTIDETLHEGIAEGEVFAERFRLLDIDGQCAIMLFGDSRFTLCAGETIVK